MAAGDFVYTNPEAARQAIAMMQLQAATAENQSRERIAREQTAQQRFATASQMAQRDKEFKTDAEIRREDISSRAGVRTNAALDAASRERADVQYSTVLSAINVVDPLTVSELDTLFAANPQLTEDYRKLLRSKRDEAYRIAKANAGGSAISAKNYELELDALTKSKLVNPLAKEDIYKRAKADKNVLLDLSTGRVLPAHAQPREDALAPSRSQMMGAAGIGVPTIADLKARITGAPRAISPEQDYGGALPPTQSTITAQPSPGFTPRSTDFAVPRTTDFAVPPEPTPPPFIDMSSPDRQPTPPLYGPANNARIFNSLPTVQRSPFRPDIDGLLRFIQHPNFSLLPPAEQQAVMDEIGIAQRMPRVSDLRTIRPEYRPPVDEYYYAPQ